jgi:hypothetical protein
MVNIVCEGACSNGRVQQWDAMIKAHAPRAENGGFGANSTTFSKMSAVDLALGRTLTHTPHIEIDPAVLSLGTISRQFRCQTCGTERRYGLGQ